MSPFPKTIVAIRNSSILHKKKSYFSGKMSIFCCLKYLLDNENEVIIDICIYCIIYSELFLQNFTIHKNSEEEKDFVGTLSKSLFRLQNYS